MWQWQWSHGEGWSKWNRKYFSRKPQESQTQSSVQPKQVGFLLQPSELNRSPFTSLPSLWDVKTVTVTHNCQGQRRWWALLQLSTLNHMWGKKKVESRVQKADYFANIPSILNRREGCGHTQLCLQQATWLGTGPSMAPDFPLLLGKTRRWR